MSNKIQKYQAKLQKAIASNDFDRRDMYRMKLEQYQSQNGGMQFGGVIEDNLKKKIDNVNKIVTDLIDARSKLTADLEKLMQKQTEMAGQCQNDNKQIVELESQNNQRQLELDALKTQFIKLKEDKDTLDNDIIILKRYINDDLINPENLDKEIIKPYVATLP
jgi:chromosome segregation ATPase